MAAALIAWLPSAALAQQALHIEGKSIVVDVEGLRRPEALNRMHAVEVRIAGRDGRPLDNASLAVQGARRFAPNELPTVPGVTPLGEGRYRIDGLRFHMAGEWTLVLDVKSGEIREPVSFDILVK